MKPRRDRAMLPALGAMLALLAPGPIPAAERRCAAIVVETDAAFRSRWPDLVERIVDEFTARVDIDSCARVELRLRDHAIVDVLVALPDGREASRNVSRSEDVIPTLQALLLLPDQRPSAAGASGAPTASSSSSQSPSSPPSLPVPRRRSARVDLRSGSDGDAHSLPTVAARELGFELSVITGARIGDGQIAIGAGVLSFLEVKSWLIGFEGRADSYRSTADGDAETALELAVLAGRRLHFGNVALDLTAGPGVAIKGLATSRMDVQASESAPRQRPPEPPLSEPTSSAVPRLLLGTRLGFSPRSVFRTFVGIDGELGPPRSSAEERSTRLPAYSVGVALGATVGTR